MHEHDGLAGTLLTTDGVSVLITGIGYEVEIFLLLWDVWSKKLPVESTVFESDLTLQLLDEVLTNGV